MSKAYNNFVSEQNTNYDTTDASSLDGNIALIGLALGRIYQLFIKPRNHLRGSANPKIVDIINENLTKPTISPEHEQSYLSPELEKIINDGLELHKKLEEHAPEMQEIIDKEKLKIKAEQTLIRKGKKTGLFAAKEIKKGIKKATRIGKPRHGAHRRPNHGKGASMEL